jgi:hypothetical protein
MEETSMSEETATAEPAATQEAQTQETPADEPLGEGGKKALDAERAARKAAEKAASDLQAQLDKINRANESAIEKAQREANEAKEAAAKATADALRLRVAAKHGISDEDADLFLTGSDEDTLTRQAERLTARNAEATSPRAPKPDANQGRSGATGPKSTADSFAEFFRNNLPER